MTGHPQARFIVETLAKEGFIAYYAGGYVRDLLLGSDSDDIDIATNAPPETIQALFPHTHPIGIAFGIILVIVDGHQYEVATFRQDSDYHDGRRPSKVEFCSASEDAKRRDFTVNGMFYDPLEEKVLDYVGGREDINKKIIRAIGDPHQRIKEDRLRMVRAVRLSCRLNFSIDPLTEEAIIAHSKELFPSVAIERIWQEFSKAYAFNALGKMFVHLHKLGLLSAIFPSLEKVSGKEMSELVDQMKDYPKDTPMIAAILTLFPKYNVDEAINLCKKLKIPNIDRAFVSYLYFFKDLNSQIEVSLHDWAHVYASPFAKICLSLPCQNKQEHEKRISLLKDSIERIQKKDPVVKSSDLLNVGITPGKTMGFLLKEAEKIAINEQITDSKAVIEKLKKSPLWDI